MKKCVIRLPVANSPEAWLNRPEQRGFGALFLAILIGETGDLNTYTNPGKVWRRMGCAPWTFNPTGEEGGEKTLMGATWRSGREGKLPASEWEAFGYSPRRRSIAYLVGEGIVKQNGKDSAETAKKKREAGRDVITVNGPYHQRYTSAKAHAYETHPEWDWKDCEECEGAGRVDGETCKCGGAGKKCLRAHRHGMLLATKMLFRNLWMEWRKLSGLYDPADAESWREREAEREAAKAAAAPPNGEAAAGAKPKSKPKPK
jgi:hypothetical protein